MAAPRLISVTFPADCAGAGHAFPPILPPPGETELNVPEANVPARYPRRFWLGRVLGRAGPECVLRRAERHRGISSLPKQGKCSRAVRPSDAIGTRSRGETQREPGEGGGGEALLQEVSFLVALKLELKWNQGQKGNGEAGEGKHGDARVCVRFKDPQGTCSKLAPVPKAGYQDPQTFRGTQRGASWAAFF